MKTNYTLLSRYICRNDCQEVSSILAKDNLLDVTYDEGKFFIAAIDEKNVQMVQILIDYFENNQLARCQDQSAEYFILKNKLRGTLETAIEDVEFSQEMKKILSPYIDFEGSEHNDSFIDDEQMHSDLVTDQIKFASVRKSYSANDLHNSTFDNSKENLLTEENLKRLSNDSSEEKFKFVEEFLEPHDIHEIKNNDLLHEHHSNLAGNLHNTDEF